MFKESALDNLQNTVSLIKVMEEVCGIEVTLTGKEFKACCPFHGENTPSLFVNERVAHCFGCGWKGNVFQFLMEHKGITFQEAAREIARIANAPLETVDLQEAQILHEDQEKLNDILQAVVEYTTEQLKKSKAARTYAKKRGISRRMIEEARIGYDDGDLIPYLVADRKFPKVYVKSLRLSNKKGNSRFHGRLTIPVERGGRLVDIYGRSLNSNDAIKHLFLFGDTGVYNGDAINKKNPSIYIVEGIIDALVMMSNGIGNVIAQAGTSKIDDAAVTDFVKRGVTEVVMIPDHDVPKSPGEVPKSFPLVAKTASRFLNQGVAVEILEIPTAGQDPAEFFSSGGDIKNLKSFSVFAWSKKKKVWDDSQLVVRRTSEVGSGPDKYKDFEFRIGDDTWVVTRPTQSTTGLKALLSVQRNSSEAYKDSISFWSATKRKALGKALGLTEAVVTAVCSLLEKQWEILCGLDKEWRTRKRGTTGLPDYAKRMAQALQDSDTLIEDIRRDITDAGYVGEDDNKVLLYIIGVSCLMKVPLGAYIASESSAGKSALVTVISDLFPPELVYLITRMTPQALYYIDENELVNKWLIVAERQGATGDENADYNLRTFFSENKLTILVPEKDESGKIMSRKHTVNGPIAYTETTTETEIHQENATRLIEINITETEKQTQQIHSFQKKMAAMTREEKTALEKKRKMIVMRHRAFISSLSQVDVRIPFAEEIDFPTGLTRARRDLLKFFGIIKAVAFIHQHQREIKTDGAISYIDATIEDYEAAYEVSQMSIRKAFSPIPDRALDLLVLILDILKDQKTGEVDLDDEEACTFTIKDLREAGLSKASPTIRKYMIPLIEQDIVESTESGERGRGKAAKYKIKISTIEEVKKEGYGITTPEELKKKIAKKTPTAIEWDI